MLLSYAGYYGYGRMYYDPTMILALIGLVLTIIASSRVNATFAKYNKVRCMAGLTGAQAAEKVLHMAGIYDVRIEHVSGNLTDHYNPMNKTLSLSDSVYNSTSVAAVGVAAHECGHAIQHAKGYVPLRVRGAFVPIANIGSNLAWPLIIIGLIFRGSMSSVLIQAGIIMFSLAVLFQLITLPVEFNASHRAMQELEHTGILGSAELKDTRKVLTAAAMTYVASAASMILQLLRLIILFGGRSRDDD